MAKLLIYDDSYKYQIVGKGNNEANKIDMDLSRYRIHRL